MAHHHPADIPLLFLRCPGDPVVGGDILHPAQIDRIVHMPVEINIIINHRDFLLKAFRGDSLSIKTHNNIFKCIRYPTDPYGIIAGNNPEDIFQEKNGI
jgi:hypothetical protein